MYSLEVLAITNFISLMIGLFAPMLFTNQEKLTLEKRVALIILFSWLCFASISYLQDKELSIFFNAAGMGAVMNLLSLKTGDWLGTMFGKR